jgi:hypothetical protein
MKLALATLVLAIGVDAGADSIDSRSGWDGGIAYQIGSFPIGGRGNTALGTRLEGGAHVGHLSLLGEYTFYDLDPADPMYATTSWSSHAHRVGATLRYRVGGLVQCCVPRTYSYGWLELGAGEQLLGARANVRRADAAAGAGWQMSFRNGRGDRQVGFFLAVRATQAAAPPDPSAPSMPPATSPTCRGSCPTTPAAAAADRSFLFTLGVVFGS